MLFDLIDELEKNKRDNEKRQTGFTLLGQILLVTMALLGLIYFLRIYRPAYFAQSNKFILIYLLITLFTLTVAWMVRTHTGNVFMVPFAMVPKEASESAQVTSPGISIA